MWTLSVNPSIKIQLASRAPWLTRVGRNLSSRARDGIPFRCVYCKSRLQEMYKWSVLPSLFPKKTSNSKEGRNWSVIYSLCDIHSVQPHYRIICHYSIHCSSVITKNHFNLGYFFWFQVYEKDTLIQRHMKCTVVQTTDLWNYETLVSCRLCRVWTICHLIEHLCLN